MYRSALFGLCGLLLFGQGEAYGQSIPIQNSSFETPVLGDGASAGINAPLLGTNTSTVGNWDMSASSLFAVGLGVPSRAEIINPNGAGPGNISGVNIGRLRSNGLLGAATTATMTQDLGITYSAMTRYTLTANVGVENLAQTFSDFGFRLLAGSNVVAEGNRDFLLTILTDQDNLHHVQLIFDTGAIAPNGNIGVQFYESSLVGVAGTFQFDNVSLSGVAVPEPTTIVLITASIGTGFVAYWRQRRRSKKLLEEAL